MTRSLGFVAVEFNQASNQPSIIGSGDLLNRYEAENVVENARRINKITGRRERYAIAEVYMDSMTDDDENDLN